MKKQLKHFFGFFLLCLFFLSCGGSESTGNKMTTKSIGSDFEKLWSEGQFANEECPDLSGLEMMNMVVSDIAPIANTDKSFSDVVFEVVESEIRYKIEAVITYHIVDGKTIIEEAAVGNCTPL